MTRPEISLIVSCSVIERQVKAFLDHVAETQPLSKIELFLVTWKGNDYSHLVTAPYGAFHVLNFDPATGLNEALAEAVRMASTSIIIFAEDHVRFDGSWVDTITSLFDGGRYAAVGWTIKPGDLNSKTSWAGFLTEYGYWGPGVQQGEKRDLIPGHSCAYAREVLLNQGEELPSLLRAETVLHWRLLKQGKTFYFTTEFSMKHYQFLNMSKLLIANFWYGWNFSDARWNAERWGLARRLFFAVGIFLKPFVRWKVLLSIPRDPSFYPPGILRKCFLRVTAAYLFASFGEACGYIFGFSRAALINSDRYELAFDRSRL